MIQSTDLRIGNYVMDEDESNEIFKVETIQKGEEPFTNDNYFVNGRLIEDILPIPLTEEILLKCGARRIDKYTFVLNGLFIHFRRIGFVFNVGKKKIIIEHLHTLQNLIFILTNTELNITLLHYN